MVLLHSVVPLIAGTTAGLVSTCIVHPIDLIKTRLQAQEHWSGRWGAQQYRGAWDALRHIMRHEGLHGLYKGLGPAIVGSSASWGLYFFAYEYLKERAVEWLEVEELNPIQFIQCGIGAGVFTSIQTNPIWLVKTRMQLDLKRHRFGGEPEYHGLFDAFRKIVAREGVLALWTGLLPALVLTLHGALQFMFYEETKIFFQKEHYSFLKESDQQKIDRKDIRLNSVEHFVAGFISKVFAASCTYPIAVIKTRVQDLRNVHNSLYSGMLDATIKIYRNEGIRGFYKGLVSNTLKIAPATGATFVVYEIVHRLLDVKTS